MTIEQRITAEANRQGVPPSIAIGVARRESGLNPNVGRGTSGEVGLFQVKPSTGADMGVSNLENVASNIRAGVGYLAWNFSRYGNWPDALMAYNAGPGNVDRGTVSPAAVSYSQQVLAWAGLRPTTGQPMVASTLPPPTYPPVAGYQPPLAPTEAGVSLAVIGIIVVVVLVVALD